MTDLVTTLEDLLVREFRTCQALYSLTRDERRALAHNEVETLANVVERKEAVLDELAQIDDQRRMVAQELATHLGVASASPTIADLANALHNAAGERLQRLREGIVALTAAIRNLTSGNQAIARTAIERADAVQSFLLDLYRPNNNYSPPGAAPSSDATGALGIDQRT